MKQNEVCMRMPGRLWHVHRLLASVGHVQVDICIVLLEILMFLLTLHVRFQKNGTESRRLALDAYLIKKNIDNVLNWAAYFEKSTECHGDPVISSHSEIGENRVNRILRENLKLCSILLHGKIQRRPSNCINFHLLKYEYLLS